MAEVLDHVRARGLRIAYEPSWRAPAPEGFLPLPAPGGPRRWAQRDEATPTRVLVVTGTVPGTLVAPEGLVEVVEAVAQSPRHASRWPAQTGSRPVACCTYYRRQGVEVVPGPVDWPLWCEDRRYHYSHVLVSDEGLTTRLWPLVAPPSRRRFASCTTNASRSAAARPWGSRRGGHGHRNRGRSLHARLLRQLEGIHTAWCAGGADASLLTGLGSSLRVARLGPRSHTKRW